MRKPIKAIQSLVDLAGNERTSVVDLIAAARAIDVDVLRQNAFHVLQAIPDPNSKGVDLIKFAAIHHVLGADLSVFAMIADSCARGSMADVEAEIVFEHMLTNGWMPLVPGPLFGALAHGKRKCAKLLNAHGLYQVPGGWATLMNYIESDKKLQMAKMLVEVVNPPREDLLGLRTAADQGSDLARWLDSHLGLLVVEQFNKTQH